MNPRPNSLMVVVGVLVAAVWMKFARWMDFSPNFMYVVVILVAVATYSIMKGLSADRPQASPALDLREARLKRFSSGANVALTTNPEVTPALVQRPEDVSGSDMVSREQTPVPGGTQSPPTPPTTFASPVKKSTTTPRIPLEKKGDAPKSEIQHENRQCPPSRTSNISSTVAKQKSRAKNNPLKKKSSDEHPRGDRDSNAWISQLMRETLRPVMDLMALSAVELQKLLAQSEDKVDALTQAALAGIEWSMSDLEELCGCLLTAAFPACRTLASCSDHSAVLECAYILTQFFVRLTTVRDALESASGRTTSHRHHHRLCKRTLADALLRATHKVAQQAFTAAIDLESAAALGGIGPTWIGVPMAMKDDDPNVPGVAHPLPTDIDWATGEPIHSTTLVTPPSNPPSSDVAADGDTDSVEPEDGHAAADEDDEWIDDPSTDASEGMGTLAKALDAERWKRFTLNAQRATEATDGKSEYGQGIIVSGSSSSAASVLVALSAGEPLPVVSRSIKPLCDGTPLDVQTTQTFVRCVADRCADTQAVAKLFVPVICMIARSARRFCYPLNEAPSNSILDTINPSDSYAALSLSAVLRAAYLLASTPRIAVIWAHMAAWDIACPAARAMAQASSTSLPSPEPTPTDIMPNIGAEMPSGADMESVSRLGSVLAMSPMGSLVNLGWFGARLLPTYFATLPGYPFAAERGAHSALRGALHNRLQQIRDVGVVTVRSLLKSPPMIHRGQYGPNTTMEPAVDASALKVEGRTGVPASGEDGGPGYGRECVLRWIHRLLQVNDFRYPTTQPLVVIEKGDPLSDALLTVADQGSSEGLLLNLAFIMLKLSQPFLKEDKLGSIQVGYVAPRPGQPGGRLNALWLDESPILLTAGEGGSNTGPSSVQSTRVYPFTTEWFFLTLRSLHASVIPALRMRISLESAAHSMRSQLHGPSGSLLPQHKKDQLVKQYQSLQCTVDCYSCLFGDEFFHLLFEFCSFAGAWITRCVEGQAAGELEEDIHSDPLWIPQSFVDDVAFCFSLCARAMRSNLGSFNLEPVMRFCITCLRLPSLSTQLLVRHGVLQFLFEIWLNEHAERTNLGRSSERSLFQHHDLSLLHHESWGRLTTQGSVFDQVTNVSCALKHLIPSLITIYVDAGSVEGLDVDDVAFDKYSFRYRIAAVIGALWWREPYQRAIVSHTNTHTPELKTFLITALNDATHLLDDGIGRMGEIDAIRGAKADVETWDAQSTQDKSIRLSFLQSQSVAATSFFRLANAILEVTVSFVRTPPVMSPLLDFAGDELISRIAALIVHFVHRLCGDIDSDGAIEGSSSGEAREAVLSDWSPRHDHFFQLKWTDPLEFNFDPVKMLEWVTNILESVYTAPSSSNGGAVENESASSSALPPRAVSFCTALTGDDDFVPAAFQRLEELATSGRLAGLTIASTTTVSQIIQRLVGGSREDASAMSEPRVSPNVGTSSRTTDGAAGDLSALYESILKPMQTLFADMGGSKTAGKRTLGTAAADVHHFAAMDDASAKSQGPQHSGARTKALAREMRLLARPDSLPLSTESSIFVCLDGDHSDLIRAIITGPTETPYAHGCFLFDIYLPSGYPTSPPLVHFCTTGGGVARLSPVLYSDGKVCLSLLGTWHGDGAETKWKPMTSSVVQVLVSIQGLILGERTPYFLEPGYDRVQSFDKLSESYNDTLHLYTMRHAMTAQMLHPPVAFAKAIRSHFLLRRSHVEETCAQWVSSAQDASKKRLLQKAALDVSNALDSIDPDGHFVASLLSGVGSAKDEFEESSDSSSDGDSDSDSDQDDANHEANELDAMPRVARIANQDPERHTRTLLALVGSSTVPLDDVEHLLDAGVNVNGVDERGRTALAIASREGHGAVVKMLLKNGADPNKDTLVGATPLFYASQNGHLDVVKSLVDSGAEKNKAIENGQTPLHAASWVGHGDIVQYLVDAGADKDKESNEGYTPLYAASGDNPHLNVVQHLLLAGANKDKAGRNGWTPLLTASWHGHLSIVKALVEAGADVNQATSDIGRTSLMMASWHGHVEIVQCLLDAGVDTSKVDKNGNTALQTAFGRGHTAIVELLRQRRYVLDVMPSE